MRLPTSAYWRVPTHPAGVRAKSVTFPLNKIQCAIWRRARSSGRRSRLPRRQAFVCSLRKRTISDFPGLVSKRSISNFNIVEAPLPPEIRRALHRLKRGDQRGDAASPSRRPSATSIIPTSPGRLLHKSVNPPPLARGPLHSSDTATA
jgi:hypothetical protein